MIAVIEITPWHWAGFILCVLFFLALDLGLFHRRRARRQIQGGRWRGARSGSRWRMLFAGAMVPLARTARKPTQFITGYVIELSLSLDNILVIALIFAWFHVPPEFQHRAAVLGHPRRAGHARRDDCRRRGAHPRISTGCFTSSAPSSFLPASKCFLPRKAMVQPEKNLAIRLARKLFPVTPGFDGQKFFTRLDGRFALTPLALVLLLVETTDLIFAVDSVPAVFSVTRKAFIVFTSNVFAILGLRSLYFLLVGAIGYFRYLKIGLSVVLVFIGVKMLLDPHGHAPQWFQIEIPTGVSLLVVAVILSDCHRAVRHRRAARKKNEPRMNTDNADGMISEAMHFDF